MAADSNQQKSRSSPFWAAACLLLIIVGIILLVTSHNNHPLMIAYRGGLVGLGVVGLIVVALTSRQRASGVDARQVAHTILSQQKSLYSAPHEYAPANPDEFPDLDIGFYASAQTALESQGFRLLDDVENMTLSQALPALRTFTRTMAGDNDRTVARISQIRPSGRFGREIASLEFCTEFNDFSFLCTTNAEVSLDAVDTRGIVTV